MSLTMLWLPIQAANAIVAGNSSNGAGFLDEHETLNIMLSIAALSAAMLTIAGPVSQLGADALGVPVNIASNAASNAYSKLFGNKQEEASNTAADSSNSLPLDRAQAEAEMDVHTAAGDVDIESGLRIPENDADAELDLTNTEPTQANASTSFGALAQKMNEVKKTFTAYMADTFAANKIEVATIAPSKYDVDIEKDRKDVVRELNEETLQGYADLLKEITSPTGITSTSVAIPSEHEGVLDNRQLALVEAAAKVAAAAESRAS